MVLLYAYKHAVVFIRLKIIIILLPYIIVYRDHRRSGRKSCTPHLRSKLNDRRSFDHFYET